MQPESKDTRAIPALPTDELTVVRPSTPDHSQGRATPMRESPAGSGGSLERIASKSSPSVDGETIVDRRGVLEGEEEVGGIGIGAEEVAASAVEEEKQKEKDGEEQEPVTLATHHDNGLEDQTNYLPAKQVIVVFLGMTMAIFLSFLDQTIVSTALPTISSAFDSGRSSSWVASAYLLTSCAVLPLWGRLSDVFGRKVCLLACVVIFSIASLGCALSTSMTMLIVFRGVKGCGGGGLLTLVLIIVSDIVSLKDRGKYQGINEITIAIANGTGPIIGGLLAEKAGWRWAFWINLPVAGLTLLCIALFLPLKPVKGDMKQKLKQVDYGGSLITLTGAVLILLPMNWGGVSFSWSSGPVLGCLVSGAVVFALLFFYESRWARYPIVDPELFKVGTVNAIFVATAFSGGAILTQLFYLPQFFQIVRGDSAIRSGVLILPLLVLITFSVFIGGQLVSRTGEYKLNIVIGYAIWAISLGLLSTINQTSSDARIIGYMVFGAVGQGQTLQTSMVAAQAAVPRERMSGVTSIRNFFRTLGGAISLALSAAIINNTLRSHLSGRPGITSELITAIIDDSTAIWRPTLRGNTTLYDLSPEIKAQIIEGFVQGFHRLFWVFSGLIAIDFLLAVFFIKRLNLKRPDEKALKERGKAWTQERKQKRKKAGSLDGDVERGPESEGVVGQDDRVEKKESS